MLKDQIFFRDSAEVNIDLPVSSLWQTHALYFCFWPMPIQYSAPDWHLNPINGIRVDASQDWWLLPDFDVRVGDIKIIWELSRCNWVLTFAQQVKQGGKESLHRLNHWLANWCENNPPYKGVNWKCGQEASIRVMHLAMAALVLNQVKEPESGLIELIHLHLQRIAPTLLYAMAQNNNHGTSEAAALFIGGSWLQQQAGAERQKRGKHFFLLGRKWLENRVNRLIEEDGSFSQYSLNYHRMMLDTMSMVEVWRRQLKLPRFSDGFYKQVGAATDWLYHMIDPVGGDGPNLGANDGAHLLSLTDTGYRDFRPSLQLAMALFANLQAYSATGDWNLPLHWLNVENASAAAPKLKSKNFNQGGFSVLRSKHATALLRYPRFHFRPSQADALHVDLWVEGENLLRDAGTYSYHPEDPALLTYFSGTASHNTVQFDDRDQMPRISRFLFGDWLKSKVIEPLREQNNFSSCAVAYKDSYGAQHQRKIMLTDEKLRVEDTISGFSKAVLRWRLSPGQWRVEGSSVTNDRHTLFIHSSVSINRIELITGWESRYYMQKNEIPLLEVELHEAGQLITEYCWSL